ncbi:hypothetical protein DFJ58DRAFT_845123 [Suillus subalutaceus]|uniref:uncharacterized protein n=1 Tax=Suillus subalutaceus TaxID=48586 RepID=UPI001B871E4F|nr:uncharacterized protein DFJ58DRAFT_845123 [Suillus subalutaceus]KAG1841136.1 hypothetical protein DFJ58DRAFT_845123 [Suillus subalutaceus]
MTPALKTSNKNQTKQVLQEKNTKLEDENSRLRAKILQLEEAGQAAKLMTTEAEAAKKVAEEKIRNGRHGVDPTHELIQKPTTAEMRDLGSRGRLLKAMKLEDNKAEYLAIQVSCLENKKTWQKM